MSNNPYYTVTVSKGSTFYDKVFDNIWDTDNLPLSYHTFPGPFDVSNGFFSFNDHFKLRHQYNQNKNISS